MESKNGERKVRRSSILRKMGEDVTVDNATTKRISFASRKSIRVFSREDETHAWNGSYEESDHHSKEFDSDKMSHDCVLTFEKTASLQNVTNNNEIMNKENINSNSHVDEIHAKAKFSAALHTTMDFVNATTYNNGEFSFEATTDITLYGYEMCKALPKIEKLSTFEISKEKDPHASRLKGNRYSFALENDEYDILNSKPQSDNYLPWENESSSEEVEIRKNENFGDDIDSAIDQFSLSHAQKNRVHQESAKTIVVFKDEDIDLLETKCKILPSFKITPPPESNHNIIQNAAKEETQRLTDRKVQIVCRSIVPSEISTINDSAVDTLNVDAKSFFDVHKDNKNDNEKENTKEAEMSTYKRESIVHVKDVDINISDGILSPKYTEEMVNVPTSITKVEEVIGTEDIKVGTELLDVAIPDVYIDNGKPSLKRRTVYFSKDTDDMIVEYLPKDTEKVDSPNLSRTEERNLKLEDSLLVKLQEARDENRRRTVVFLNEDVDIDETSLDIGGDDNMKASAYEGTPHRSIVEFENLENELRVQQYDSDVVGRGQPKEKDVDMNVECADLENSELYSNNGVRTMDERRRTTHKVVNITPEHQLLKSQSIVEVIDESMYLSPNKMKGTAAKYANVFLTPVQVRRKERKTIIFKNSDLEDSCITQSTGQQTLAKCSSGTTMNEPDESIDCPRRMALLLNSRQSSEARDEAKEPSQPKTEVAANGEDNPITISDVSTYFGSRREVEEDTSKMDCDGKDLENLNLSTYIETFQELYLNLTCDIGETQLSLVESLTIDNCDDCAHGDDTRLSVKKYEDKLLIAQSQQTTPAKALAICCDCRKVALGESGVKSEDCMSTLSPLVLPAIPPINDSILEKLRRLRQMPTLADVSEHWRLVHLSKRLSVEDLNLDLMPLSDDECEHESKDFISKLKRKIEKTKTEISARSLRRRDKPFLLRVTSSLKTTLRSWLFSLRSENKYQFDNRKCITFCLLFTLDLTDMMASDVRIKNISFEYSCIPVEKWHPLDILTHIQLKCMMPVDMDFASSNDSNGVLEVLGKVDKFCAEAVDLVEDFWSVVFKHNGTVVGDKHRVFVQKIVRRLIPPGDVNYSTVESTVYKLEVYNIHKICYKDIVEPPLYSFCESIQHCPCGLEFLAMFLKNPASFLKSSK